MNRSQHEYTTRLRDTNDLFYPIGFFNLTALEKSQISAQAEDLSQTPYENSIPCDIEQTTAREQYRDLNAWNRQEHEWLNTILEQPYRELAIRITRYAVDHQEQLETMAAQVPLVEVPYQLAALPPTLFEHRDPTRPFIPDTDEEIALLVSEFAHFNRRLARQIGVSTWTSGHPFMYVHFHATLDLFHELQRRRDEGDQLFTTAAGQELWRKYRDDFKKTTLNNLISSLHQNAIFTAYGNNRRFSEAGRFFDKTDGIFDSYLLADFPSGSLFTRQIRTPIGKYGPGAAQDLALGTHMLMELINNDQQFVKEIKAITKDPSVRSFLWQHLMRSSDRGVRGDSVEHGIKQTAFEGVMSLNALFSTIEADGIPGYEEDLWEGLSAVLADDVPTKVTAVMPLAVIQPMSLHGNYFHDPLINREGRFRVRPDVAKKWQEIHTIHTVSQHAAWSTYRESGDKPPVRFGLHCPFKGSVVKGFAEALMVCRAIAHDRAN